MDSGALGTRLREPLQWLSPNLFGSFSSSRLWRKQATESFLFFSFWLFGPRILSPDSKLYLLLDSFVPTSTIIRILANLLNGLCVLAEIHGINVNLLFVSTLSCTFSISLDLKIKIKMPKLSQTTAQNCIDKKQRLCLQLLVLLFYFTLEDRHIFPSNILFWFIISTSRSVHPIVAVFQSLSYILLCNPMDYSPPGFPVLHYLPEFLRFMSTESVMLSNHPIFCHPFLLLLSIFSSIRVFSNKSALSIRWPKYWSFTFSITPSNEYSRLMSFRID